MRGKILNRYDQEKLNYKDLEYKIKDLISSLLKEKGITIHGIESRVKDRDSLSEKIANKDGKYSDLNEITDILGLRVITYFEDDVDEVANIIKNEFYLDVEQSVDKRDRDSDTFGYSSLHYILKLKEPRLDLSEYSKFGDYNFEIQIRSILQHAWAEIEHDLGYKSKISIPAEKRRDFARIAGLLELADNEFIRIKDFLDSYSVTTELKIKSQDLEIPIDKITLTEYTISSESVQEILENICAENNIDHTEIRTELVLSEQLLRNLHSLNISTIKQLDELLNENKKRIPKFINLYKPEIGTDSLIGYDMVFLYLLYVITFRNYTVERLDKLLKTYEVEEEKINEVIMKFEKLVSEGIKI